MIYCLAGREIATAQDKAWMTDMFGRSVRSDGPCGVEVSEDQLEDESMSRNG